MSSIAETETGFEHAGEKNSLAVMRPNPPQPIAHEAAGVDPTEEKPAIEESLESVETGDGVDVSGIEAQMIHGWVMSAVEKYGMIGMDLAVYKINGTRIQNNYAVDPKNSNMIVVRVKLPFVSLQYEEVTKGDGENSVTKSVLSSFVLPAERLNRPERGDQMIWVANSCSLIIVLPDESRIHPIIRNGEHARLRKGQGEYLHTIYNFKEAKVASVRCKKVTPKPVLKPRSNFTKGADECSSQLLLASSSV
jgi:hypothetical protein